MAVKLCLKMLYFVVFIMTFIITINGYPQERLFRLLLSCPLNQICAPKSRCADIQNYGRSRICLTGFYVGTCCRKLLNNSKPHNLSDKDNSILSTKRRPEVSKVEIGGVDTADIDGKIKTKGVQKDDDNKVHIASKSETPENLSSENDCGKQKIHSRKKRIVNGTSAHFGEYPWQVLLKLKLENCGGTILNSRWIITAAHCIDEEEESDVEVTLGEYKTDKQYERLPERVYKIDKMIMHPKFDLTTYEYDLGLLRTNKPIAFSDHIQPICLPHKGANHFGQMAVATGWGRTYPNALDGAATLQKVALPVIDNQNCEQMFEKAGRSEHLPSFFLCAGYKTGLRDTCNGDSGGPLQIEENDRFYLIGVMSWGIGCAEPNKPGVYIKVSEFIPWIMRFIEDV